MKTFVIAKIYGTYNYEAFELHPENRDLDEARCHQLDRSIAKNGFIPAYPCYVVPIDTENGKAKYRIVAGAHRYHVLKRQGKPIPYVVCEQEIPIADLEVMDSSWSLDDFVTSGEKAGFPGFQEAKTYAERVGMTYRAAFCLFAGEQASGTNTARKIKYRTFEIRDREFPELMEDVLTYLREIPGPDGVLNTRFIEALDKVMRCDAFDAERFKKQAKRHAYMFEKKPSKEEYVRLIDKIYNHYRSDRVPLEFEAVEAARRRSIASKES